MKKLALSFKYAFCGIGFCIKSCRNFRIHMVAAAYVWYFSRFYGNDTVIDSLLLIIFALVLAAEAINCALEQVCNTITTEKNTYIKHAKDAAAGAVLITALFAAAVWFMFYFRIQAISEIYMYIVSSPLRLILFTLSVVISVLFIFYEDILKNGKERN